MTIPDDRLAEIEALYAKATPGEWLYDEEMQEAGDYRYFFQTVKAGAKNLYRISGDERDKYNAECIAAMHNALPELLRGYRAWRAVESGITGTIEALQWSRLNPKNNHLCITGFDNAAAKTMDGWERVRIVPVEKENG